MIAAPDPLLLEPRIKWEDPSASSDIAPHGNMNRDANREDRP
jgi:hypothetical protein